MSALPPARETPAPPSLAAGAQPPEPRYDFPSFDVVCCAMEHWDNVWRRNQFFASELLRLRPTMRMLFLEQAVDVPWSLAHRRWPGARGLRPIGDTGRLSAVAPRKWLPRRLWPGVDRALADQALAAARRIGLRNPVLWVNDSTYAPLVQRTGWPAVYDLTDDWLLGRGSPAEHDRQRRNDSLLLETATEVVACSPSLAESRGRFRSSVHLIPNGVDVDHFRCPQPRPPDLPHGRVVLYVGTLSEGRLDMDLCAEVTARLQSLEHPATLVLVGPNCLSRQSARRLELAGALFLGSRPYDVVPAYLQHADVIVVPHRVTPFTESLDPIKAREAIAVARPTVSTPVAGFRELGPPVTVASADRFAGAVDEVLRKDPLPPGPGVLANPPVSWAERAREFLAVLEAAASARYRQDTGEGTGPARGPRTSRARARS
jgi:teichuronic acid biosynthesis glycosyltransferase TuaH